jgi:AraC family transcriptional regulator, regulatory protein of adaptative response / methylated-DNA-[protein]-cysteine methyltransferase
VDGVARRKRIAPPPAMAQIDGMANTLVTDACRLIEATDDRVPTAPELARALDVSTDALRRAFRQVLGVTPRQYADSLRRDRLRRELRDGEDVTRALFTVGYGSTSRLYEGVHEHLGMTPASYRAGGAGTTITFTVTDSPLGALLIAVTERGLCKVDLADDGIAAEWALTNEFHQAEIRRDDDALAPVVAEVLARIDGHQPARELPLDVRGTAFQRRVWEELQQIPLGETRTYGEIAAAIDAPRASRAVGSACGANPVPVVVPCHRVVPASGGIGNYGLGPRRKQQLLEHEGATPSSD